MDAHGIWPGPADVGYFTEAQAGNFGETLRGFLKFLELPPGLRVLDVGTGPGLVPRLLLEQGARLAVGSDDSPAMLRRARDLSVEALPRAHHQPDYLLADAARLPFASGSLGASLATNLLFLLPDPAAGLAELVRVVGPGGTVGILNPTDRMSTVAAEAFAHERSLGGFAQFSFINYGRLAQEHRRLSLEQWAQLARDAGLQEVTATSRAGGLIAFVKGRRGA